MGSHEEVKFYRSSICCLRRHRRSAVLTLSLSDLRRDPHSALVDIGRDGHSTECGRPVLGELLTAGAPRSVDLRRTIKSRVPQHVD